MNSENDFIFLEREYIINANRFFKLPEDAIKAIIDVAKAVKNCDELLNNIIEDNNIFFHSQDVESEKIINLDVVELIMGDLYGIYPILVLLSNLDELTEFYKAKNISDEILVDTLMDLNTWMLDYFHKYGHWGVEEFEWLVYTFKGEIFKIGRLQFMPKVFEEKIQVFQNKNTNEIITISKPGVRYRGDGQVDGTNDIFDEREGWEAKLVKENRFIKANSILGEGKAVNKMISLSSVIWESKLKIGDMVLDMHIRAGSRMDHELCIESMRTALEFFSSHFPQNKFVAFTCESWLLGPCFKKMLPVSSNIRKFQNEFCLYPILTDDFEFYKRVFGGSLKDISMAPQDTELRRSMINYIKSGKQMYSAAGFIII